VSRRASLPGADELFRRTGPDSKPQPARESSPTPQVAKSTRLQVASDAPPVPQTGGKAPKHDEKITFYCTRDDLMAIEKVRLSLRAEHCVAADRGRIVRAALAYVLEDYEARTDDSILLRRLGPQ
jgi:hypothetical protein